jgi:type II secretory pathway pseudopilin PulG
MTAMQKRLFHGRTLTCQRCAKPFTITEQTPDPAPVAAPLPPREGAVEPGPDATDVMPQRPPPPPTTVAVLGARPGAGLTPARMTLLIVSVAIVLGMLLYAAIAPSVRRSREQAYRATCQSNLTQIGAALQMYANINGGRFPDTLGALVADGSIPAELLVCPATGHTPAPGTTPSAQAWALANADHASYIYVGKGLGFGVAKRPLAYEPLEGHVDGTHVLFTDGSVQFMPGAAATATIPQLGAPVGTPAQTKPAR